MQSCFGVSERRACRTLGQSRSSQRYRPNTKEDEPRLVARILELVSEFPRYGYRRITRLLRQEGWRVNFKRIHRLWKQQGLKVPVKQEKGVRRNTVRHESCALNFNDFWHGDCASIQIWRMLRQFDTQRMSQCRTDPLNNEAQRPRASAATGMRPWKTRLIFAPRNCRA
ncbi:IS3 family transposase [Crateriforma conspicua]|uniref:IS3 family transposase n=1 Tax=Crateriforma conspicua TaxID=2527996 RepID=UPI0011B6C21B